MVRNLAGTSAVPAQLETATVTFSALAAGATVTINGVTVTGAANTGSTAAVDADGDPVTSCAIDQELSDIFSPLAPTGKNQKVALAVIRGALQRSSTFGKAGAATETPCLKFEDAIPCVADAIVGVEKRRRPTRAREAITGLIEGNHIWRGIDEQGEEWVWVRT